MKRVLVVAVLAITLGHAAFAQMAGRSSSIAGNAEGSASDKINALWDQALYTEKLVKSGTLKEAFTPGTLNDGEAVPYGFGWGVGKFLGLDNVSHSGSWLGFRTYILRFPNERFTVVILSNVSQLEPAMIASKISKICLGEKDDFSNRAKDRR